MIHMKAQAPSEIGLIIVGVIFVWTGITVLGVPAISPLVGSFNTYVGGGFILAGIVVAIKGALRLLYY